MASKSITNFDKESVHKRAKEILDIQRKAINALDISEEMIKAIELISNEKGKGKVITTGMGKAGIIAFKMSATLASIGIPSFFVSPAEAAHGDLGRIEENDLVIAFSNSGNTDEVAHMISSLHNLNRHKNSVILITANATPKIPCDLIVRYEKVEESCVVKKVPSTSTTVMLIIADILAITAAEMLGLNDEWFKIRHPGGSIGKSYREEEK